jgi:large subunit ribosomal protein L6
MSNIGLSSIYLPKNIVYELQKKDKKSILWIKGPFTSIYFEISPHLDCEIKNGQIFFKKRIITLNSENYITQTGENLNKIWSLYTVCLKKILHSASVGFKKYLRVRGVGYKFVVNERNVEVFAGLSHKIGQDLREEFLINITRKQRMIKVRSRSLQDLTNSLSSMRLLRKPNPFTGKGIRFRKETLIQKEGKKRKTF